MMRRLFLTVILALLALDAVAQLGLEPTLKVPQTPTLQPSTKPAELNVKRNAVCPCNAIVQEPVYQDGRIVRYQSVRRPTGISEQRCCP